MDLGSFEHWGVVVRPGETVNCDPGTIYCHISQIALQAGKGNEDVRVFVKVAGQEILLGTLSVDKYPQHTTDLVFDKDFELLHSSKTSNIFVIGYKFSGHEKRLDTSTEGGKETQSGEGNSAGQGSPATQSSKPKPTLEETKCPRKLKVDVGGDDKDELEGESDDDEEEEAKTKNKLAETPPVKKAK